MCVCVCERLTDLLFNDCEQVGLLAQQEVALSLLVSNLGQQFVLLCSECKFGNEVLNLWDRCWERGVSVCVCVCVRDCACMWAYVSCLGLGNVWERGP